MRIGQRYGETDTGRKRRRNEDAFVCDPPLFAVADGMGGAQAGELASSLAAAALRERGHSESGGEERVIELIREANRRVHQRAQDDANASGMGTTMTVALVSGEGTVTIGHVGDSRAYVLRRGELEQLTEDHSLVAELVRRGELSPAEAEVHPQRSVITRALGTDPDVDVDAFSVDARPGDVFLLCSDGLTTMVDGDEIATLVDRHRDDLVRATRALIDAANDRGGDDNITAVLFELADGPEPEPASRVADDADEADTLHPEDRVPALSETAETVPIPATAAAEVSSALEPPPRAEPSPAARVEGDTAILAPAELEAALAGTAAVEEPAGGRGDEPHVPLWRMLLAAVVILVLSAAVILLVTQGLAR
jgi:protein phosphatase